jgi:hypothetical protein
MEEWLSMVRKLQQSCMTVEVGVRITIKVYGQIQILKIVGCLQLVSLGLTSIMLGYLADLRRLILV